MKAWQLNIRDDPDQGTEVIFAETRNEARKKVNQTDFMYESWLDVQARRFKAMDDKEHLNRAHLTLELWREHDWHWWDIPYPHQDETTDAEFLDWYEKIFGDNR